jgi:MFS family permease
MATAVAPLRHSAFRILWIVTIFSAMGSFIQSVAASWLMLELTNSATWVGLMVASSTLPLLFFALAAGAIADMFDRVKVMLVAQVIMGASAAGMAVLTAADLINPGLLLGLGLLLGTGVALNLPAWQALLPNLVPRGLIASAVALQSVAFNVARAIGPALGGALLVTAGAAWSFAINAVSYLLVVVALVVVGRDLILPDTESASFGNAILLGIRFTRFTPQFARLLLLTGLFAVTSSVVQAVLPNHTLTLGGEAGVYGLLLGAMGVGALIAAFVRQPIMERMGHRALMITILVFGVCGVALGLASNIGFALAAMLGAGFAWLMTLTDLRAVAQLMSPEWIRGRTMAIYTLSFGGIVPLGAILAGVIADAVGTSASIVILSSGTIALGLLTPLFRIPQLGDVVAPEFSPEREPPPHDDTVGGGPVVVLNAWDIDEADVVEFTALMNEVRLVRLRSGAYRWRLFRYADNPLRLVEFFAVGSWEEHLAQHARIDDASADLIARARAYDRGGGPRTRHLIAVDVEDPPGFENLLLAHEDLHRSDGSIPDFEMDH